MITTELRYLADIRVSNVDKHSRDGERQVQLCNYVDVYRSDVVGPSETLMRATASSEQVARFRLQVGDSVLTKDSEDPSDIGISAYVAKTADNLVCGYHLAIVRPNLGVHPRFLNWALRSWPVLAHFSAHASGISRYGLGVLGLRGTPIPFPSIKEQRRIAEFLDENMARIDKILRSRRIQRCRNREAFRAELAMRIDDVGARVGWGPLRRFEPRITQGWSPQASNEPALPGESGVVRLGVVRWGNFNPAENKAFLSGVLPREELRLSNGDLLMTRANTPALVGDVGVVEGLSEKQRLYLSDLIYRISSPYLQAHFASAALRTPKVRQTVAVVARGTSGSMPKLRAEDIAGLPVPLASERVQAEIGQWDLRSREHLARTEGVIDESLSRFKEYKQSLITAAVTGQIDVTASGSNIPR